MSTDMPQRGHIRVTTGQWNLPVEVRDQRMRLIDRGLSGPSSSDSSYGRDVQLDEGTYMVSVRLPGGRQLAKAIELHTGDDRTVELEPESESLLPRVRYTTAAGTQPAEPPASPSDLAFRFLRMKGLSKTVPDPPPRLLDRADTSLPGSFTARIEVPSSGVDFVQLARSGEVPLNVALLPRHCLLTVEEQAGTLAASALPYGRASVERAAQYLAAGEEEHAALLISGRDAERLLQEKLSDPIGAAIGGYILLRLHELERTHNWTRNLAAWFGWLPDGAVIAGEKAAMLGDHLRAVEYFLQAGRRGLPLLTDGFSILVSRLRQYQANTRIHARLTIDQAAAVRALSARLEEWSSFVDFSALALTFRAAKLTQPAKSQHPVDIGRGFSPW